MRSSHFEDGLVAVELSTPSIGQLDDGVSVLRSLGSGESSRGVSVQRHVTREEGGSLLVTHQWTAIEDVCGISLEQRVDLDLPWTSYVIAPGAVYAGNRFLVSPQPYAPFIPTEGVGPDGPILMADVPRLASATGYRLELAGNAPTTPFIGIYDPESARGVLVQIPIYGRWGVSGVTVTTLPGERVSVALTLPVQRLRRYRHCDWIEADEPGMNLRAGESFESQMRLIPIGVGTISGFISELSRRSWAARDRTPRPGFDLREAVKAVEAKLDSSNWDENLPAYRTSLVAKTHPDTWLVQSGWVGGGVTALAMLYSDEPSRRERARRMFDFLCTAQAPSGYFYGAYKNGRWLSVGGKRPGCRSFMLVRRPLELGRDLLKAVDLLERRGEALPSRWLEASKACLDAVVRTESRFGHLGYSVDPETGDVLWGDSTCGAYAIEYLVHGFRRFGDRTYLDAAKRLAAYYRENFLLKGFTCGGVGDALMAVDSESSYALLAGLVALYAETRDPVHLAWAVEGAEMFQTWVLLYDAQLPPDSPLGLLGVQPRGAVLANIQNQHGAPGICTASGAALATLSRLTGDNRWMELLHEIIACMPQMVVRPGQEDVWGDLPPGCISERLMTMDGMKPAGHTACGSHWCEISLLLAYREAIEAELDADHRGRSLPA